LGTISKKQLFTRDERKKCLKPVIPFKTSFRFLLRIPTMQA